MSKHRHETLEEAWASIRNDVSDEVAQQAVLETMTRTATDVDEIAYFITRCKWLKLIGYDDGRDTNQIGGQRTFAAQLSEVDGWSAAVSRITPEMILLLKERAGRLWGALGQAQKASYKPQFDTTVCSNGHKGRTFFRVRKNGEVQRGCAVCASEARRRNYEKRGSRTGAR